jgi:hypothetical protein
MALLTGEEKDLPLTLAAFSPPTKPRPQLNFQIALIQLGRWRRQTESTGAESYRFTYGSGALRIRGPAANEQVRAEAIAYVEGRRQRDDVGGDKARELARVLRGMAGEAWGDFSSGSWQAFLDVVSCDSGSLVFGWSADDVRA